MNFEHDNADQPFNRRIIPAAAIEGIWRATDGHSIRRIDWLSPSAPCRGSLLFMPGRGDAYEKYLETLDYWHGEGWRVTAMDWRGQALSGRLGFDATTGHVEDFAVWIQDLAEFWSQWKANRPGPHVLVAHSMGGHVALRALAERRIDPDAVVLSAPMLLLAPGPLPASVQHAIARFMLMIGDARRPAWQGGERPRHHPVDRSRLLTHDRRRYEDELWWRERRPQLEMGAPSWGWIERAIASGKEFERSGYLEAIYTPVLFLASRRDKLVVYAAIERAARRMPRAQLVSFGEEARHEILREVDDVRDSALAAIDDFLGRAAPPDEDIP